MAKVIIRRFSFAAFVKFSCLFGAAFGLGIGAIAFGMALLGAPVSTHLGAMTVEGIPGGLLAVVVGPLVTTIAVLPVSLIAYLPANWYLNLTGGLTVRLDAFGRAVIGFGTKHQAP